jgi:hypothetical protein
MGSREGSREEATSAWWLPPTRATQRWPHASSPFSLDLHRWSRRRPSSHGLQASPCSLDLWHWSRPSPLVGGNGQAGKICLWGEEGREKRRDGKAIDGINPMVRIGQSQVSTQIVCLFMTLRDIGYHNGRLRWPFIFWGQSVGCWLGHSYWLEFDSHGFAPKMICRRFYKNTRQTSDLSYVLKKCTTNLQSVRNRLTRIGPQKWFVVRFVKVHGKPLICRRF